MDKENENYVRVFYKAGLSGNIEECKSVYHAFAQNKQNLTLFLNWMLKGAMLKGHTNISALAKSWGADEDFKPVITDISASDHLVFDPVIPPNKLKEANTKLKILEISRREDAAVALPLLWEVLMKRNDPKFSTIVKANAMLKSIHYQSELSNYYALVLWSKNPRKLAEYITRKDEQGCCLLDVWPVIFPVITLNGYNPAIEPFLDVSSLDDILDGFEELANILSAYYGVPAHRTIYVKCMDPFVRYSSNNQQWIGNWENGQFARICAKLKSLRFTKIHYGFLDVRRPWQKVPDLAKKSGVILETYNPEDPSTYSHIVQELAQIADKYEIRLVTCADTNHFGIGHKEWGIKHNIRQGVCCNLEMINFLLNHVGYYPIAGKAKTNKPTGNRKCPCPPTFDIGQHAKANPENDRQRCHGCVYCFVRATHLGTVVDIEDTILGKRKVY